MSYRMPIALDSFGAEERRAVHEVLDSGRYTQGERVAALERAFAQYVGASHAIMVNSGSSANLVAITATNFASQLAPELTNGTLRSGDEVIISALCWPTTITPLLNLQLRPVFCDVELDSLNLSVETVARVRTKKTRGVVAVSVLGNPSGMAELRDYCRAEKLVLWEDAAESLGAHTPGGDMIGALGLTGSFSFYFSHHITTMEGGCVTTNEPIVADLARSVRAHGWTRFEAQSGLLDTLENSGEIDPRFHFLLPGYNVRSTEIAAAVGLVQLSKLPGMVKRRRELAQKRADVLATHNKMVAVPGADAGDGHSWMAFPMLFDSQRSKAAAQASLERAGVETRPIIAGNILQHPIKNYLGASDAPDGLTACDHVFRHGFMIGIHPQVTDDDEAIVCEALDDATRALDVL